MALPCRTHPLQPPPDSARFQGCNAIAASYWQWHDVNHHCLGSAFETPREGTELQQPGDENIISLAKEREINVDVYLEVPSSNRKSNEHSRHCCFYQVRRACLCAILQCVYDGCQYFWESGARKSPCEYWSSKSRPHRSMLVCCFASHYVIQVSYW